MGKFIGIPASRSSLLRRKLVYGVGINDSNFLLDYKDNGKTMRCPIYSRWKNMLRRCYDPKFKSANPTYLDCTVCSDWLTFSVFREWMAGQDFEGKQLDKDLHIPGNKVYSARACQFVSNQVNTLLCDSAAIRGDYPQGVSWYKQKNKFRAGIKINGRRKHLGYFSTPESAERCYLTAKRAEIVRYATLNKGNRQLFNDLMRASRDLKESKTPLDPIRLPTV